MGRWSRMLGLLGVVGVGMVAVAASLPRSSAPAVVASEDAAAPSQPEPAIRVVDGQDAVRLLVATRTLEGAVGEVRLVGMVHMGTPAFYAGLDVRLADCGRVLYEGIVDEGREPAAPESGWARLADALDAVFQNDAVDVFRPGWVHADLTVAELERLLRARGADPEWIALVLGPVLPADMERFVDLMGRADPRTRAHTRLAIIDRLGDPHEGLEGDERAHYEAVLIEARNQALLAPIDAALAAETGPVCVLYGAAHLPDLEARLTARGLARTGEQWDEALDVTLASMGIGPVQLAQFRRIYGR